MVRPFVPWGLCSSTPTISSDAVDVGCPVSPDDIVLVETPSLLVKDPWSARNLFLLVVRGFYFHYWSIFKTFSFRGISVSTEEVVEKIKKKDRTDFRRSLKFFWVLKQNKNEPYHCHAIKAKMNEWMSKFIHPSINQWIHCGCLPMWWEVSS